MAKELISFTPQPVPRDEWVREKPAPLLLITAVDALHQKMMHMLDADDKEDYLRYYDSYHDSIAIEGSWYADRCVAAIKMRTFATEHRDVIVSKAKLSDIIKASEKVARAHGQGRKQRLLLAMAAAGKHTNGQAATEQGEG